MKILVFTEYFPTSERDLAGGVEKRAFHLLGALAKKHDVSVICSFQGKSQKRFDRIEGIDVMRVGMVHPYSNEGSIVSRLVYAVSAFVAGIVIARPDVVDGYSYLNYPIASVVGRIRNASVVLTYHESWSTQEWVRLKGWVTGMFGAVWTGIARSLPFDRIVAVSNETRSRLIKQGISAKKVSVVYNGIDVAQMHAIKARVRPHSVMTSARLIKSKRVDVLVRAVDELRKEFPDIFLTIHGDGEERKPLEKLISQLKLQKQVIITGRINSFDRVLKLRKQHQVFCLPSEVEGFGMVVVEAMASGIPVVCSDIPVLHEITGDKGALFFRVGDHKALAQQLRVLFIDQKMCAQKQKEGVIFAQKYDWKRIAADAEKVYREVVR
ncbi:MAG: glycosyltransferase family 4 protein [Nanoarchaeota archaeon]